MKAWETTPPDRFVSIIRTVPPSAPREGVYPVDPFQRPASVAERWTSSLEATAPRLLYGCHTNSASVPFGNSSP